MESSTSRRLSIIGGLAVAAALTFSPAVAASAGSGIPEPIIGGSEVQPGQYPFMAALLNPARPEERGGQFCGGSLLTPNAILTAAHCVTGLKPSDFRVAVGRTDLSNPAQGHERGVKSIDIHPDFSPDKGVNAYDIAVVTLDQPVFGVTPVTLPTTGTDALLRPGSLVTALGWGTTEADQFTPAERLRMVPLPILDNEECALSAADPESIIGFDPAVEFCASVTGKSACYGDSGGPLVKSHNGRFYQIGIVSRGLRCAGQGTPGIYTSLSSAPLWDSFLPKK